MTDQLDLDGLERLAKAAEADWSGENITPNTVAHFHHFNPTMALALISQAREAERMRGASPLNPVFPNVVRAMLDRFDRAKGKGGYPSANEREAMRRCLDALAPATGGGE